VILGRQPAISLAELESIYGPTNLTPLSSQIALVKAKSIDLMRLGGTIKAAQVITCPLIEYLGELPPGKITLGLSDYSKTATARSAQTQSLKLKSILKRHGRSVRIVPNNTSSVLSSATAHHNQLGEKPLHIEIITFKEYTAISVGTQNITAYARRDQARPARDAAIGMLPPKLAQILINLASGPATSGRLLDPFCGTGTILQEAHLIGLKAYGTDLSSKMIAATKTNLEWLARRPAAKHSILPGDDYELAVADATSYRWRPPIDFIASEIYLGQAFSAPPSDAKLRSVQAITKGILLGFLRNIYPQLAKNTPLALAIPAWRRPDHTFSHLDVIDEIKQLGYNVHQFKHATPQDLLYCREQQVVARQIIVLRKT